MLVGSKKSKKKCGLKKRTHFSGILEPTSYWRSQCGVWKQNTHNNGVQVPYLPAAAEVSPRALSEASKFEHPLCWNNQSARFALRFEFASGGIVQLVQTPRANRITAEPLTSAAESKNQKGVHFRERLNTYLISAADEVSTSRFVICGGRRQRQEPRRRR